MPLINKLNDPKEQQNLCKKYTEYEKDVKKTEFKKAINILGYQNIVKSLKMLEKALTPEICSEFVIKTPKQSVTATLPSAILTQDPEEIKRLEEAARRLLSSKACSLLLRRLARRLLLRRLARSLLQSFDLLWILC